MHFNLWGEKKTNKTYNIGTCPSIAIWSLAFSLVRLKKSDLFIGSRASLSNLFAILPISEVELI